jgi:ribosomal protein L24
MKKNHIYVENLNKCDKNSGTILLEKIINIAKELKYKNIKLSDASTISFDSRRRTTDQKNCNFPLSYWHILSKGKSWYNSLGFISNNYSAIRS